MALVLDFDPRAELPFSAPDWTINALKEDSPQEAHDDAGSFWQAELLDRLAGLPFKEFEFHGFQGKRRDGEM